MQFVTSGLPRIPTELTRQAINILSFHDLPPIQKEFFVLQVVNIGYNHHASDPDGTQGYKKHIKKNLKKTFS